MKKFLLIFLIVNIFDFVSYSQCYGENSVKCSQWAEESINNSIELNLIPENLQSSYTAKITRQEFCQLAIQTYTVKTGNTIDENVKSPFSDIDDIYITNAYNLKIVSGVGNNKFAPNNNITRQEAAVMLNNLADAMNIENGSIKNNYFVNENYNDKFVDESYFADWAKNAIYTVCGIKSGDTYIMAGTGNGKFSPWMNYTREQAIATMYRLYNCEVETETSFHNILTRYSKPLCDESQVDSEIEKFKNNNKEILKDISAIDYVGDEKFLVHFGGCEYLFDIYKSDYSALMTINGGYIIPKTKNLIINIGYGKFAEFSLDGEDDYLWNKAKIYDINGNALDLKFDYINVNMHTLGDDRLDRIKKETSDNYEIIEGALNYGLVPFDRYTDYIQYNWNISKKQFFDSIINLGKIFNNYNTDFVNKISIILSDYDSNSFNYYEDLTSDEAMEVFKALAEYVNDDELLNLVEEGDNTYYSVEDTVISVYNIYSKTIR